MQQQTSTRDWETTFLRWAQPPGQAERDRCENAVRQIHDAISASPQLANRKTRVFAQGSYANRVNVRRDSDVDVGVSCSDTFFYELPEGIAIDEFRFAASSYSYAEFKDDVERALVAKFGSDAVVRGNKAFDIKASSHRVEADVAPFFEHRRYLKNGSYHSGVELQPDNKTWQRVINWPDQHYDNCVSKNTSTSRRYKGMVRILKSLRNDMDGVGISAAGPIPGFLSECMVYNAPDTLFFQSTMLGIVRAVLTHLITNMPSEDCTGWTEVSELKWLFHGGQKWTRNQARDFLDSAWAYLGFQQP